MRSPRRRVLQRVAVLLVVLLGARRVDAQAVAAAGQPAQLDVRAAGERSVRITLTPLRVTVGGALRTVSVFEPKEASFQPVDGAWDLALWQARYKRAFIARIRKALSALPAYSRR